MDHLLDGCSLGFTVVNWRAGWTHGHEAQPRAPPVGILWSPLCCMLTSVVVMQCIQKLSIRRRCWQKSPWATLTTTTGMQGAPSWSQTGLSASAAPSSPAALSSPAAPPSPAAPSSPLVELSLIQGKSSASPATPTPTGILGQSAGSRRTTQWLPLTTSHPKVIWTSCFRDWNVTHLFLHF